MSSISDVFEYKIKTRILCLVSPPQIFSFYEIMRNNNVVS